MMNLGKIAVLKPDHLGDLVLSSPAIRVLQERLGTFDLLVSKDTLALAYFLFSKNQQIKTIDFSHLSKTKEHIRIPTIAGYDTIISLREDFFINLDWLKSQAKNVFIIKTDNDVHETELQKKLLYPIVGGYNPIDFFGVQMDEEFTLTSKEKDEFTIDMSQQVGLCISAGHSSNAWPMVRWFELGMQIQKQGIKVVLIGGPSEKRELHFLAHLLNIDDQSIIVGSNDFHGFIKKISMLGVVITNDSGTAHICSLSKVPMISLFGSSPYRRFRPMGSHVKVISLDLNCSPCLQFSKTHINLCISRECLSGIEVPQVMAYLNELLN